MEKHERDHMRIVIVGHVDHGKSTLIGRLFFDTDSLPEGRMEEVKKACEELGRPVEFAYLMDQLEEEREQNVTIDTAQTFFKTDKRHYVIIDAPGHVEFVKNMITGASQAEAAILIVDAEEGVQEQTKRHAYILSMLGLQQVIVVLNKMDKVDYSEERFEAVRSDISSFLGRIGIEPSYIIPISAMEGDNVANVSDKMAWFDGPTILEALDTFKASPKDMSKPLRYPVQDIYKVGDKRVLVGRVESGIMKPGKEVMLLPSGKKTKVKSIEVFEGQKESAGPGECIGITIEHPLFVERGEIVCEGGSPLSSDTIKAHVFWMSKEPYTLGEEMLFRCATQEIGCKIESIDRKLDSSTLESKEDSPANLSDMEIGEVTLKLKSPAVVENFNDIQELGRFVLTKGLDVSAGGIISTRD
ncbi:MAG: elongation factor Tu [Candidatus Aenigmatarchaeota archaeon]|nr:MAG: elongation factor Tu [Candidatus Aenigmarchaeota archaeon]